MVCTIVYHPLHLGLVPGVNTGIREYLCRITHSNPRTRYFHHSERVQIQVSTTLSSTTFIVLSNQSLPITLIYTALFYPTL